MPIDGAIASGQSFSGGCAKDPAKGSLMVCG